MSVWRGLVAGLVGGLAGAGAMSAAHSALSAVAASPSLTAPPRDAPHQDDSTVLVAAALTRAVGRELPDSAKPLAGSIVHYGFGGAMGAAYGGLGEIVPGVTRGLGLPFGIAVWGGAHALTVPALGLSPPPWRRPFAAEATEFAMHLLYGAVAEAVRRLLRRAR